MPDDLGPIPRADEEHRRAANGYLLWPLALANIVREDTDATIWSRIHARQALMLGAGGTLVFLLVLASPLLTVVTVPTISASQTIGVYAVGLVADVAVGIALLVVGIRYAARAARGELFTIPVITRIVDRWLLTKRP